MWLLLAATVLMPSMTPTEAPAQPCTPHCTEIVEAVLDWYAAEHGMTMGDIVVDTASSGYEQGFRSRPGVTRPLSSADLLQSLTRLGVIPGNRTESWTCSADQCDLVEGSTFLIFLAPRVDAGAGEATVLFMERKTGPSSRYLAGWTARLSRSGDAWTVTEAKITGRT